MNQDFCWPMTLSTLQFWHIMKIGTLICVQALFWFCPSAFFYHSLPSFSSGVPHKLCLWKRAMPDTHTSLAHLHQNCICGTVWAHCDPNLLCLWLKPDQSIITLVSFGLPSASAPLFSIQFLVAFYFHLNFRSAGIWDDMQEGRYICCNEACASSVTCWLMLLECFFSLVPDCDSFYPLLISSFFMSNGIKSSMLLIFHLQSWSLHVWNK